MPNGKLNTSKLSIITLVISGADLGFFVRWSKLKISGGGRRGFLRGGGGGGGGAWLRDNVGRGSDLTPFL